MSCASPTFCVTVNDAVNDPEAIVGNPITNDWTVASVNVSMSGAWCTSTTRCIAVGENGVGLVGNLAEPQPQPKSQTITFDALAGKTLGDPDFAVNATASSGLPVSYTAAGPCTISGATVHMFALGRAR